MLPKWHFLTALILSAILWPFFKINVLIIIFSAVFIDVDHYILYIYRKKDFSLMRAYSFFKNLGDIFKKTGKTYREYSLCIFHTVEFFIILFILGFISPFFQFVFLGCSFHVIIDILSDFYENRHDGMFISTRALSIMGYIYEYRKIRKKIKK